jgi:hypothetical protein
MQPQQLTIDMSGQMGLTANFYGDSDQLSSAPQMRVNGQKGEMASGLFNPYFRVGYLAPTVDTTTDYTYDTSPTTKFISSLYDFTFDKTYFGNLTGEIYMGSSLTDTSLTQATTVASSSTTKTLYDLESYVYNGDEKIYALYSKTTGLSGSGQYVGYFYTTDNTLFSASAALVFTGSGSTAPTLSSQGLNLGTIARTGTTVSASVTVSSTSDVVYAIVTCKNSYTVSSLTCGGSAMTVQTAGTPTSVYYKTSPTVGSNTITLTLSASTNDFNLYAFVVSGATGTASTAFDAIATTTDHLVLSPTVTSEKSLFVQVTTSNDAGGYWSSGQTLVQTASANGTAATFFCNLHTFDLSQQYLDITVYNSDMSVVMADILDNDGYSGNNVKSSGSYVQVLNTDWAFMRPADNGFLYLFADNHVHKLDGTVTGGTGTTYTKDVLLFPDNFRITDAIDYRSEMYIALQNYKVDANTTGITNYKGQCGLFVWNKVSTQLNTTSYIEVQGAREIKKIYIGDDDRLRLITISDSGLTELRKFDYDVHIGIFFSVVKQLGVGAYPQYPDGMDLAGERAYWIANNGNMYCVQSDVVTILHQIKTLATTASGANSNIATGAILYGSGAETADAGYRENKQAITFAYTDGTVKTKKIYPFDTKNGSNSVQTVNVGNVYTLVNLIPIDSLVQRVRVYNAPTVGTGSTTIATLKIFFNQSTSATFPDGMTKTITKDDAHRGYVDFNIGKAYVNAIQLKVEWDTSITLDGDIYLPSAAVVLYTPTLMTTPDNG